MWPRPLWEGVLKGKDPGHSPEGPHPPGSDRVGHVGKEAGEVSIRREIGREWCYWSRGKRGLQRAGC